MKTVHTPFWLLLAPALSLLVALYGCQSSEERIAAYLASARELHAQGNDEKAIIELRNVLQLDEGNEEANAMMAEYYEARSEWPRMLRHLEMVIRKNGNNINARLQVAKLMLMGGDQRAADEQVSAVEALEPENARGMMLRGIMLRQQGSQDLALQKTEMAYAIDPSDAEVVGAYASMLVTSGKAEQATSVVRKALESQPEDASLNLLLFQTLASQQRHEEAISVLAATVRRDPHQLANWRALAIYQARNVSFEAADATLRDMVGANPESVEAKLMLASFLGQRSEEAAIDELKRFIAVGKAGANELKLALGEAYLRGESLSEASQVFQDIVSSSPTSEQLLNAQNQLARIALRQEKTTEAAAIVEDILAKNPRNPDAVLVRSAIALAQGRVDDAILDLRSVLRDHPDSDKALVLLAEAYAQISDYELVERSLVDALKINPLNERAAIRYAQIRAGRQDYSGALGVLETLSQGGVQSKDADALGLQIMLSQRDWSAATKFAGIVATRQDQPAFDTYVVALTLQAQERYRESIEQFQNALDKNPRLIGAVAGIVRAYAALGEVQKGLEWLNSYAAKNPDRADVQLMLANELARTGREDEARAAFEAVIASQPQNIEAYRQLGGFYLAHKDTTNAVTIFTRAIEANPASTDAKLMLANAVEQAGDLKRAEVLYREILSETPTQTIAANNLAVILAGDGGDKERLAEARAIAARFEATREPFFADTLGWIYHLSGDNARAQRLLQRAVDGAPEQALFHYHLGVTLMRLQRTEEARPHLERAEALAREHGKFEGYNDAIALLEQLSK